MFSFFIHVFSILLDVTTEALQATVKQQTKQLDDVNSLKDSTNDLAEFSKNTFKKSTAKKVQQQLRDAAENDATSTSTPTKQESEKSIGSATVSPKNSIEHIESPTTTTTTTATYSVTRNADHLDNYGTIPNERTSLLSHPNNSNLPTESFKDSNLEARKKYRRKVIIITVILGVVLLVVALSILLPLIFLA